MSLRFPEGTAGWTRWLGAIWTLVRTDFKVRYHGTLGGFVWALLKPLSMFIVLMSIFSYVFANSRDYTLNLVVGLFLWDFFVESTKVGIISLHTKAFLVAKTRFPRWIVVATAMSNALVTLAVFSSAVVLVLYLLGRGPSLAALVLYAFYLVNYALIVFGISLGGSVLFLRYRDLNQVWEVVIQGGFFFAPIIYPLAILPERVHFYLFLWPPTPIVEFARMVLVQGATPSLKGHAFLVIMAMSLVTLGGLVFWRLAPSAAEKL
jgi:lipopolysaccharide transport system permease protein